VARELSYSALPWPARAQGTEIGGDINFLRRSKISGCIFAPIGLKLLSISTVVLYVLEDIQSGGEPSALTPHEVRHHKVWCRPGWATTVTYLTPAPAPPLVFLYQQLHTTIS
jgi:hypothetical protein